MHEITAPVVPGGFIYQGDDLARLTEMRRSISLAERGASGNRLGDADADLPAMREEYDAAVDEASARAVEWAMTTTGGTALRALIAEHPPRRKDESSELVDEDAAFGVNVDTFARPFVLSCLARPQFGDIEAAGAWYDARTLAEQEQMFSLAWMLNMESGADPKGTKFGTSGD